MNEQDKLIEEQLNKMPRELSEAIRSTSWQEVVRNVSKEFGLSEEKSVSLKQETAIILYAFDNPANLAKNISNEVGVPKEDAEKIAEALVNKVFLPIQEKADNKTQPPQPPQVPEIAPEIHPMVEPSFAQGFGGARKEEVHTVPPVEQPVPKTPFVPSPAPTPSVAPKAPVQEPSQPEIKPHAEATKPLPTHYPQGQDPYREPVE